MRQVEAILERTLEILWRRFYSNMDEDLHSLFYQDARTFNDFYRNWRETNFKEQQQQWSREEKRKRGKEKKDE